MAVKPPEAMRTLLLHGIVALAAGAECSCCMSVQLKRTNVGIALVSNPRVLFLDEPTSGNVTWPLIEAQCLICVMHKSAAVTALLLLAHT